MRPRRTIIAVNRERRYVAGPLFSASALTGPANTYYMQRFPRVFSSVLLRRGSVLVCVCDAAILLVRR